jgi:superfamily I DNA and/or RNA helicase
MGRSIFDVRLTDPHSADVVVMLNVQYRMHPVIGDLVSRLYYDGKLKNDASTFRRDEIAGRRPFQERSLEPEDRRML